MSWDIKSERITARAAAEKARAEAEAIRAATQRQDEAARAETKQADRERRRRERQEQRQAFAATIRRNGDLAVPVLAVGSPALIAWRGQFEFALDKMQLGLLMSPLLPVAIEGGVLYMALLAHRAVADDLPAGRYRALTWVLAGVAAGMNYWHGSAKGAEVGVALALTSLLSILLLELTVALRKARQSKQRTGRDAAQIRRALIRRVRYPRLSLAAAGIAAARGVDADEAWRAAWVDRYGMGPEAGRQERRTARAAVKREGRAARKAARSGGVTVVDGQVVPAAWFDDSGERTDERPVVAEDERSRPLDQEPPDVRETVVREAGQDLARNVELYLSDRDFASGALLELPHEGLHELNAHERAAHGVDGIGERSPERPLPAHDERPDEQSGERSDERPVGAPGDDGERPDERSGERSRKRPLKGRRRPRKGGGRRERAAQDEHAKRLAKVRRLLAKAPDMSGAEIEAETGIPESTARRLKAQIRAESGGGEQS